MKLEDIIEVLNKHIEVKRYSMNLDPFLGHLVLQKSITTNSNFKAYKVISYTLWFVNKKGRYKVIYLQHSERMLESNKDSVIKRFEMTFIELIFNWIGSNYYNDVINGKYTGIEQ